MEPLECLEFSVEFVEPFVEFKTFFGIQIFGTHFSPVDNPFSHASPSPYYLSD